MALFSGYIRQRRHKVLGPYLRGDVLDLGCGLGTTITMLGPGQGYVGVELFPSHVEKLRKWFPDQEFHARDLDDDELALGSRRFDTVVLLAVIEHLAQPKKLLSQLPDHMRPKSRLLITTPTPFGDSVLRVGTKLGLFHPHGVTGHQAIYGEAQIAALLDGTGIRLIERHVFLFGGNQLLVCDLSES
jgi:SAM-dependent methyltransferase